MQTLLYRSESVVEAPPRPNRRAETLDPFQQMAVVQHTKNLRVLDLGGYDGDMGLWLLERQPCTVTVVDKAVPHIRFEHDGMDFVRAYFKDFHKEYLAGKPCPFDVALLSYPVNNWETSISLIPILKRIPCVIYIGKNGNGTVCGTEHLWKYLVTRTLTGIVEGVPSSVLVYGGHDRNIHRQPLVAEEYGGLHMNDLTDAMARQIDVITQ